MIQIFLAHGRTDGTGPIEGSTRGPRGPKNVISFYRGMDYGLGPDNNWFDKCIYNRHAVILNHLKKYRMMVEVKLGWGRRAEFPPVKSRRFSWPYPTHLQWILILPLLGVNWFCDPHANLYCQPFVITVPCKNSDLEDMSSASNQRVKAGWPTLLHTSACERNWDNSVTCNKYFKIYYSIYMQ